MTAWFAISIKDNPEPAAMFHPSENPEVLS